MAQKQIKKSTRITLNFLKEFIESLLKDNGLKNLYVSGIYPTRYSREEYEAGASKINIIIKDKTDKSDMLSWCITCSYSCSNINSYIKSGYELYLKTSRLSLINGSELELRKKTI